MVDREIHECGGLWRKTRARVRARVRVRCGGCGECRKRARVRVRVRVRCSECPSAAKKSENKFNPRHPGRARPRSRSRLRVFRCIRYIGRGHGRGRGHVFATLATLARSETHIGYT